MNNQPYPQFAPPPPQRRSLKQWYQSRTRAGKVGWGCLGFLIVFALCSMCSGISNAIAGNTSSVATATPDTSLTQLAYGNATVDSAATSIAQDTAPTPTAQPIVAPTRAPAPTQVPAAPTHAAQPTPAPKPSCNAVNNNPWCYNFSPGKLITNPPADFCSYFNCIASFVSADDPDGGYIVECADGTYSQSGGESGSCSHHGGNLRPLYSH